MVVEAMGIVPTPRRAVCLSVTTAQLRKHAEACTPAGPPGGPRRLGLGSARPAAWRSQPSRPSLPMPRLLRHFSPSETVRPEHVEPSPAVHGRQRCHRPAVPLPVRGPRSATRASASLAWRTGQGPFGQTTVASQNSNVSAVQWQPAVLTPRNARRSSPPDGPAPGRWAGGTGRRQLPGEPHHVDRTDPGEPLAVPQAGRAVHAGEPALRVRHRRLRRRAAVHRVRPGPALPTGTWTSATSRPACASCPSPSSCRRPATTTAANWNSSACPERTEPRAGLRDLLPVLHGPPRAPVTRGTRCSLVAWASGQPFR
jgi:hypothetical protein